VDGGDLLGSIEAAMFMLMLILMLTEMDASAADACTAVPGTPTHSM
jgi:hypothetical protein